MNEPQWRKSSRSGDSGGDCVEVADNLPGRVMVRDTKDRDGGTLTFAPEPWRAFVAEVAQRPDRPPVTVAAGRHTTVTYRFGSGIR